MSAAVDRSRAALLATVSEDDFRDEVMARARARGWRRHHSRRSKGFGIQGERGFPDVTLVRRGRMVCLELKTTAGRMGPGQDEWIAELAQVPGVEAAVVSPADWPVIDRMLA